MTGSPMIADEIGALLSGEQVAVLRLLADPAAFQTAVTALTGAAEAHRTAKDEATSATAAVADLARRKAELEKREAAVTEREAHAAEWDREVSSHEGKVRHWREMWREDPL